MSIDATTITRRHHEDDKRQLREDARRILSTPEGRRIIVAVFGIGGLYAETGSCGGSPVEIAYKAGGRDKVAQLLTFCNSVARDNVLLAMRERSELSTKREQEIEQALATTRKDAKE